MMLGLRVWVMVGFGEDAFDERGSLCGWYAFWHPIKKYILVD